MLNSHVAAFGPFLSGHRGLLTTKPSGGLRGEPVWFSKNFGQHTSCRRRLGSVGRCLCAMPEGSELAGVGAPQREQRSSHGSEGRMMRLSRLLAERSVGTRSEVGGHHLIHWIITYRRIISTPSLERKLSWCGEGPQHELGAQNFVSRQPHRCPKESHEVSEGISPPPGPDTPFFEETVLGNLSTEQIMCKISSSLRFAEGLGCRSFTVLIDITCDALPGFMSCMSSAVRCKVLWGWGRNPRKPAEKFASHPRIEPITPESMMLHVAGGVLPRACCPAHSSTLLSWPDFSRRRGRSGSDI